ncbi:MAG: dihydrofolate reductase family protein [Candidatus Paceibacterota bacterium]|jgi:dihydrofolate reductase
MKTILHMAVSADGYIAKLDGNSDWVSPIDVQLFEQRVKEAGCLIVGRKTFGQYTGDVYPIAGVINIVLTLGVAKSSDKDVITANYPEQALEIAKEKGFSKVMLVGGGKANGSFLRSGLIDEIFLSVHPIVLNNGVKLFEGYSEKVDMTLLDSTEIGEGLVQLHYNVMNKA